MKSFPVIVTAAVTSLATLFFARQVDIPGISSSTSASLPVNFASYEAGASRVMSTPPVDFQAAAEASVKAVVHIRTTSNARTVSATADDDPFGGFFGQRRYYIPQQNGSGSGVVISPDGYIVTNNHVVAGTDQVTVTFNDRYTTKAKVVGTDPAFDIAVLKVNEKSLPYMELGNSDEVKLGQWVLAVGYPLTLDATVTAGIVSAKSRSIGINRTQAANAIESFIQTDAAVNPGNSGGALVNISGQLIGINSAIASPTGSYAGYSYAIPANLVRKVTNDLMKYGSVQRAYLGISYLDRRQVPSEKLTELGIDRNEGVYVNGVSPNGGAMTAGIHKGDFIKKVNGVNVRTETELLEQVARYQPGDNVSLTYTRGGAEATVSVQLRNLSGSTALSSQVGSSEILGATVRSLTKEECRKYDIDGGVLVENPGDGALRRNTDIRKGFIITSVNDGGLSSVNDLQAQLSSDETVRIGGFYPGSKGMFYFGIPGGSADPNGRQ